MTPQATLGPALPVTKLSGLSPLPRSSSPPWMTMARPPTKASEASSNDTILSKMTTWVGRLSELATMLPKSPTCLLTSVGAPWFFCNYKVFIKDVWLINLFVTLKYIKWVEVSSCVLATIAQFTLLMDVESMLARLQASQLSSDHNRVTSLSIQKIEYINMRSLGVYYSITSA